MDSERIRLEHNEGAGRYELWWSDQLASYAEYTPYGGDVLVFNHTVTNQRFRGRGLAARVVRFALDDVRDRGQMVVPRCSFVASFVNDNPGYRDLVARRLTA